jgi:outer membrane lipoprotein SlyB
MNTSTDNLQPGAASSSASKPLWLAIGVLGAAVLAMGGVMLYQQRTPAPPEVPVAIVAPQAGAPAAPSAADDLAEKPALAPAKPATVPAKKVVKPSPAPSTAPSYSSASPAPAPYTSAAPVVQVCTVCGSVESVTPVQRSLKPAGVGVGTVAGGVLGAVVGNQVGQGNGRTVATILGAIGGGFAGNAIEKNVRKETVYQVGLRMEDGSHRTVELAQAPGVGSRVTLEGSGIRSSDGVSYHAPAPVAPAATQQAPSYSGQ